MTQAHLIDLNRDCHCFPIERDTIEETIFALTPNPRMPAMLSDRPNYFARTAVFVSQNDIDAMQSQIRAIENTIKTQAFKDRVLSREPSPAHVVQVKTHGAFMGYDFHITPDGPRLIEINSNAGGAFIVNALEQTVGQSDGTFAAQVANMFQNEWALAGRTTPLTTIAIVDDAPETQFHYPDMCLAAALLREQGFHVLIAAPEQFTLNDGALYVGRTRVDMIYNRLTDFALQDAAQNILFEALIQDAAIMTPHPRHHALFADKRNLAILSDESVLKDWKLPDTDRAALKHIPKTLLVTPENIDTLWQTRKNYYFKPTSGFGSRGAFRGAKITTKTWQHIRENSYVAQELIAPPVRAVPLTDHHAALKFDMRVYTYDGTPLLLAARVYQGQTTNLRTEGGGLAPVIKLDDETTCLAS